MGIEPTRTAPVSLWNASFCEERAAECDWPANFRVMRGNAGLETTNRFALDLPLSPKSVLDDSSCWPAPRATRIMRPADPILARHVPSVAELMGRRACAKLASYSEDRTCATQPSSSSLR